MSNLNKPRELDSSVINTKRFVIFLCLIVSIVVGFYFFNFNDQLSNKNEVWGTFGDYVGGILNPVIAAFAFYLIAKTYELQKSELEQTRDLLKVSTNAQQEQIKLAALTSLLNSNLMKLDILKDDKSELWSGVPVQFKERMASELVELRNEAVNDYTAAFTAGLLKVQAYPGSYEVLKKTIDIEIKIKEIVEKNVKLEKQIEGFCKSP